MQKWPRSYRVWTTKVGKIMNRKTIAAYIGGGLSALFVILLLGAGGKVTSPTGTAPDRYVYYPGTEALRPDEIRITACGTGLPAARRGQAASCFLFELGNGDKFLFDIGTGSMANIASMMIPMDFLTKIFISHLHTDHWGDLAGLWAGGGQRAERGRSKSGGRAVPARTWEPSTPSSTSYRPTTGTT